MQWGGVERGWEEVSARLDWVAEQVVPGLGVSYSPSPRLTVFAGALYFNADDGVSGRWRA